MKPKFISDPQDPFGDGFNTASDGIVPNFFPASIYHVAGHDDGSFSAGPALFNYLTPTPVVPSEAVQAQAAQNGPGGPGSVVAVMSPSGGFTINLLFDAAAMAAPASFRAGIQQAASILSATITDKITVNLKIDYSGIGGGAAAGPDAGYWESYSSVRTDLINNATPGDTTFNALPSGTSIQGQTNVAVWNAQLKLWGILGANDTTTDDGSATFATDINSSLLVGVALHELTHAMGRVPYGTAPDIFDLFRFTSAGTRLFAGGNTAPAAYFSLNGGITKLADFGQTSDPSDFLNSGVQGPNDPFNEYYSGSTLQSLTAVDKEQLDALGFHLGSRGIVVAATGSEAVQGGAAVTLLSGPPTITDTTSTTLSSATIKVANASGSAVTGDLLYVNGVQNGSVGNGVTASWNASTGTLTLTGSATLAVYDTLLSEVSYQDTGTDSSTGSHPLRTVTWTVNDGTANFNTTSQIVIDRAPVTTVANVGLSADYTPVAASSLLTASDPDGDAIATYAFKDTGNGHFFLNGVAQSNNQEIDVTAAQLSQLTYQSSGGADSLQVRVSDGTLWSTWQSFSVTGPTPTVIEAFGSTSLVEAGTNYFFYPVGGSSGPELQYAGGAVVAGEFGAWVPIGAEQTATGYEVAWQYGNTDQYLVWNTDSSGNDISIGSVVSGTSLALETAETVLHQDLNGDGVIGIPTPVTIQTDTNSFGSTSLVQLGNHYFLDSISSGSGPELENGGAPVVAGGYGAWSPIGAAQTATGYEVAWQYGNTDQYLVWNTDSSGNDISIGSVVSGTSLALETAETVLHQDLNGDGVIGIPTPVTIQTDTNSFGSTSLVQLGNHYFLDSISSGSGPELENGGAPVVAGGYGAWSPIGAAQTATGYEVAWQYGNADQYLVWNTDSSGNDISIGSVVSGTSLALETAETVLHQDLNGDGVIGIPTPPTTVIESFGSTSLVEVGTNFFFYPVGGSSGPELQYAGAPVVAGAYGAWAPIGAEQTASGYEVAWKFGSADQYLIWNTDSSGNDISIGSVVSGTNLVLETAEIVLHQDLNGDGVIGIPSPATTFSLQYKGFDYVAFYNGAYENSSSLPSLVQTGANSIEATLDYGINVATSQVVADPNYTDSLAALGATIAQAEKLGLSVMVRPLIDFLNPAQSAPYSVGDWRQNYHPNNVAAFFTSYQQMIVQEAQVAQANGAQMLSIGAELDQLAGSQYLSYWTNIITAVRQVFTGALTYSASWSTASQVSFWSQLNYEGIDCYIPLSNAQNPTLQTLVNGWLQPATAATDPGAYAVIGNQSPIQYFENLAAQSGKPLLFTELGYANDSGAAADPSASGSSPNPTLQAELYQAFFQAWTQSHSSSLIGAYFWEWDPNGSSSNVGPAIDSFSPQNNPAQSAATAGFAAVSTLAGAELVLAHAGTLEVASGTTLHINDSAINNTGDMLVAGTLAVDASTLTLDGTGTVTLTDGTIVGSTGGETLHNNGNTISGTGAIGDGSGHLALDNASGTIEASGGTLVLDTGATITNAGTLQAAGGATLRIDDSIAGTGGAVIGAGATLELAAADSGTVMFNSPTGTLILDHASAFSGQIIGFTGDGTLAGSDHIDLRGVNYGTVHSSYDSATGVLDVSDGTTTVDLKFAGTYSQDNFKFANDGSGGTIVYDPPTTSQPSPQGGTASDTAGQITDASTSNLFVTAGHDSFVFAENFGQVTIADFSPTTDTIQISKAVFANIDALLTAIHDDSHGNAVITDANHDTITIQNVTTAQLQAHQSHFHLV